MKIFLNENEIQQALEKGIITSLEAREMLMAYLGKTKFAPIVHEKVKLHQVA